MAKSRLSSYQVEVAKDLERLHHLTPARAREMVIQFRETLAISQRREVRDFEAAIALTRLR